MCIRERCKDYDQNSNIIAALIKLRHDSQNPNISYDQLGLYLDERDRLIGDLILGNELGANSKTAGGRNE